MVVADVFYTSNDKCILYFDTVVQHFQSPVDSANNNFTSPVFNITASCMDLLACYASSMCQQSVHITVLIDDSQTGCTAADIGLSSNIPTKKIPFCGCLQF